jgi:cbb3-type cytochrome oxidase maturation protein
MASWVNSSRRGFAWVFVAKRSLADRTMSVIFIALPIALLLAALAVAGFVTTVTEGQYDDLETPPQRMLCDDLPVRSTATNESK